MRYVALPLLRSRMQRGYVSFERACHHVPVRPAARWMLCVVLFFFGFFPRHTVFVKRCAAAARRQKLAPPVHRLSLRLRGEFMHSQACFMLSFLNSFFAALYL